MFKFIKKILESHSAGSTVKHSCPFSELAILENNSPLDEKFIQKWVSPFYMNSPNERAYKKEFLKIKNDLTKEVIKKLLGEPNWRMRYVGASFSAIKQCRDLETNIGNLLLRSEVCYAGSEYCFALASFNTKNSVKYLQKYLRYYLKQHSLWFDQGSALSALIYLDEKNNTSHQDEFMEEWTEFIKDKENWNLDKMCKNFKSSMQLLTSYQDEM